LTAKVLEELKAAVVVGNVKKARKLAAQSLQCKIPSGTTLDTLTKAMKTVDERYNRREYFVTEVAQSAAAMREALKILQPYIDVDHAVTKASIVIGSLKGNVQGLGKDIVAASLQAAGFRIVDVGVDVDPGTFVKTAIREEAQIIAVSISMKDTIPYLEDLVGMLESTGLRARIKVLIGGNAVSDRTCKEQGVDAYATDAQDAIVKVETLLAKKPRRADDSRLRA
jgi:5-methyltetrahydrofolate--homocysteine methyltransferase